MSDWIPYGKHAITEQDIKYVVEALKSETITQGPRTEMFERNIAKTCKSRFGVTFNSATSALHAANIALGVKKGDIVWTSTISFVASANCAIYCGADVDFIDCDTDTGLISIKELGVKLESASKINKLPKVIIPVHLGGSSCDMREMSELSAIYGFRIIEDASHAIGSTYDSEPVGNCKYSDITVFSFHPVKIITSGEGGCAVTNSVDIKNKLSTIRSHGIKRNNFEFESPGDWYYEMDSIGFNYRMNDLQASLGLSQLERLQKIIRERRRQIQVYKDLITDMKEIRIITEPIYSKSCYHLAIIQIMDITKRNHSKLFKYMRANGIGVQLHYWPIHLQPFYRKLGFQEGDFPNAETYSTTSFSIPLYPGLTGDSQKKVVQVLGTGLGTI